MGRYCTPNQIKAWLTGYDIPGAYTDEIYEQFINPAECDVDAFIGHSFGFERINRVLDGDGARTMLSFDSPLFAINKLQVRFDPLSTSLNLTEGDGILMPNRDTGKLAIRPSLALVGSFPSDYSRYFSDAFYRGENNVILDGWVGHHFVGDNYNEELLHSLGLSNVMLKSEDATKVYFTLPRPLAIPTGTTPALSAAAGLLMYKGANITTFADASTNWKIESPVKVSLVKATEAFDATKLYRLLYIPAPVALASMKMAAAYLLSSLGGRNDSYGSGGASSRNVQGFSESYKEGFMYSDLVKDWRKESLDGLKRFRGVICV